MHAQLKMIEHAPSVQMQDAPGSVLYSLKNENGEDKENLGRHCAPLDLASKPCYIDLVRKAAYKISGDGGKFEFF